MKKILTLFLAILLTEASSQNFTWVRGSNQSADLGNRGTMGVPNSANDPSGRHGGANWVDNSGNLWTFGGEGYDSNANFGHIGDIWRYNPTTNEWTWMNGQDAVDFNGVYGTIGVPSSTIYPGSREFMSHWKDNSGNFWFFGGLGWSASSTSAVYLNDVWRYNPTTNQWTYFGGSTVGGASAVYGTLGVASSSATPGGRKYATSWTDLSGNFWLFGGFGFGASTFGNLNDLWKYNPSTNQWAWMGGGQASNINGVYGTINVPSTSNIPGGRHAAGCTQDNAGNFYLFGGLGYPAVGVGGYLNDLWKFNPTNLTWTWVSGTQSVNIPCNYGTQNQPSSTTLPGGRYSPAMWKDGQNSLWMFGGRGQDLTTFAGDINDFYRFDLTTNQWTWLKGSQNTFTTGVYGTMGVPNAANVPGSREYANVWSVQNGVKLWMLGGEGNDASNFLTDHMNDLWLFEIPCKPDSIVGNNTICSGTNYSLTAYNTPTASISWYASASSATTIGTGSLLTKPTNTNASVSTLTVFAQYGTCTLIPRTAFVITVNPIPMIAVAEPTPLCQGINSFTAAGASIYTWSYNNLSGSVVSVPMAPPTTTLSFTGTDNNGCSATRQVTFFVSPSPTLNITSSSPSVCPGQSATLTLNSNATTYTWNTNNTSSVIAITPSVTTNYTVTGSLDGCASTATFTQHTKNCNGLQKSDLTSLRIWPNPSSGKLYIESEQHDKMLVFDAVGKKVAEVEIKSGSQIIELVLPAGIYICQFDHSGTTKLIIQ